MAPVSETHECEWKEKAERLEAANVALVHRLDKLERAVFGKKSEKLPGVEEALDLPPRPREETLKERRARRAARVELPTREIHHAVAPEHRHCPKCGSTELRPLGEGKKTVVYEYVPARLERQVHVQETLSCRCGEGVVTAEAPKAIEKGQYGPGFLAHIVVQKCCDAMPLYRQAKALSRAGVPVARTKGRSGSNTGVRGCDPLELAPGI